VKVRRDGREELDNCIKGGGLVFSQGKDSLQKQVRGASSVSGEFKKTPCQQESYVKYEGEVSAGTQGIFPQKAYFLKISRKGRV